MSIKLPSHSKILFSTDKIWFVYTLFCHFASLNTLRTQNRLIVMFSLATQYNVTVIFKIIAKNCIKMCLSHISRTIHPIYFTLARCIAEDLLWARDTFNINKL